MTKNNFDFDAFFKPISDAFNGFGEQVTLAMACKMRRFQIGVEGTDLRLAEGVIFGDGSVVIRWLAKKSTTLYPTLAQYEAERKSKHVLKFIDAEPLS